jgi:hypothetical protein
VIDEPVRGTAKATDDVIRSYVRNVPEIYAKLEEGWTRDDFARARAGSLSPHEREVAETFHRLFSDASRDDRIEAELVDGRLIVHRGRHRVDAAAREGVALLPVHVRASDDETLANVKARLELEASTIDPTAVESQRRILNEMVSGTSQRDGRRLSDEHEAAPTLGVDMTMGAEGFPTRKNPEYEPRPGTKSSQPERDDARVVPELGRTAVRGATEPTKTPQQERLERALGKTGVDAARTPHRGRQ